MSFGWLKHYMPRGLYGRAALILVLPVAMLLAIMSFTFIQRHLEDVTQQMTGTVVREVRMVRDQVAGAETQQELIARVRPFLASLNMKVRFLSSQEVPEADRVGIFDFTGGVARDTLKLSLAAVEAVELLPDKTALVYLDSDLGPIELTINRRRLTPTAPHQLIVTMVFCGFLMTAIASLYMRNQLRPITRLARAAKAFGRGQNVAYHPGGATEVREAGNAFIDMRARIERQIEQRTMMLSGVSHDLRTPLTRLKLGLSMLDERDAEPLLEDVNEMQRLVDSFLDFSRGASEGEVEKLDPQALAARIVEDAQRAGKPVTLLPPEGEGRVKLRPDSIRRALQNLVDNAVRYGNRAEVSVAFTPKSLRLRVEDDGPGIPPDQRGEALKPFARLDPSRNQNKGTGVGLGLAIVADIARAHGGTLRLGESERLGGLCADIVIGR
ncbi:ATP-binding protein [Ruegeria sp. 2205SS24-7]|uniref:ATP-binding protein n=1 Tax=Ruegeria discodermiae TaxID=3064389 RepID=UPI002741FAB8|nr:ATP-binding protein [Ruegeria sp. 2205SS24-7]MDP5216407.1 ATP-binding protein [Ruegeria sp. 2205SS24-7]